MTTTAHATVEAAEKSQQQIFLNVDRSGLLQRKCDCGKTAGITGACSDCQSLQTKIQPGSVRQSATAPVLHELIQPKLTIGAPNDRYEQEADHVADQVMSMPDAKPSVQREVIPKEEEEIQTKTLGDSIQREAMPEEEEQIQTKPLAATITPLVQREAVPEEEEELQIKALGDSIQREAMSEEEEEIQTKRSPDTGFQTGSNLESRLSSSQGGGSPLPDEVRTFMEPRFGADFSQVRVHTGGEAVQMNRDLNAQAFTHKQNVYFGSGKAPAKDALTAHELTHVVQQTGGVQMTLTQNAPDIQQKCSECEEDEDTTLNRREDSNIQIIQREIGDGHNLVSSRFTGDTKLEACFDNKDRLREGDTGDSVVKIQQALLELGHDLGKAGVDGIYGSKTGSAVRQFKIDQSLTPTTFTDVGPKTMARLDEIFSKGGGDLPDCPDPDIVTFSDSTEDIVGSQNNAKALVGSPKALCQIKPPTNLTIDKLQDIPANERRKLSFYANPVSPQDVEGQFGGNFIPFFKTTPIFSSSVPSDPKLRKGLARVVHFMRNNVKPAFEPNKILDLEIKAASGVFRFTNLIIGSAATGTEVLLIEKTGDLPSTPAKGQFATDKTSFETKYKSFGFKLISSWSIADEISTLDDALTFVPVSARNQVKNLTFDRSSSKVGPDGEAGHFNPNTNTVVIFKSAFEDRATRFGQHNFLAEAIDHEVGHATAFAPTNSAPNAKLMAEFKAAAILDGASNDTTGKRKRNGKSLTVKGGITEYSDTDFNEYYAESFSLFSIAPTTFELLRPNIFKFFFKHFPFP